ncbi:hypothetical protein ACJIZ3_001679 [Penstemon smallii]|uniref:Uncharacterized protein n=1 Tax=Penstemon smallii TaxID=265156 RepID=A0ABD3U631_9LAMI
MASISMATPIGAAATAKNADAFFNQLSVKQSIAKPVVAFTKAKLKVDASLKVAGITSAAALANFLLSLGAGGVVLFVIAGAVVGVSNFDPFLTITKKVQEQDKLN